MICLENEVAKLTISEQAAEIHSFKDKETDTERMWQGDANFWSGRNPILFPLVSNTYNKEVHVKGNTYSMGNHGFLRHSTFTGEKISDTVAVFRFRDNEETYAQYPYHFDFSVTYTLKGKRCEIVYRIENLDEEKMPFQFGLHPAFCCPLQEDQKFEDYRLVFSNEEMTDSIIKGYELKGKEISLNYEMFEKTPTLLFENVKSSSVLLTDGAHGIKMDISGYRWLAFWTKCRGAKFVCIEPWHGHGDFAPTDVPFEQREGTIVLEPQHHYITSTTLELV